MCLYKWCFPFFEVVWAPRCLGYLGAPPQQMCVTECSMFHHAELNAKWAS